MRLTKKIVFISLAILVVVAALANWGVNVWVNQKLPKLITEKNKTPYYISYKDLKISVWSGDITANEITISPKSATKDTLAKTGIYAKIKNVKVANFSIWNVLFSDKIKAKSITVNTPEILIYQKDQIAKNRSKSLRSDVVEPFEQIIQVSNIYVNKGNVKIIHAKLPVLSAANINVKLEGILINDAVLKRSIPFSFKTYAFNCDSIYYRNSPFYHIKANTITTKNTGLSLKNFEMVPEVSRAEFVAQLPKEKDFYALKAKSIAIKDMDAGFKDEQLFFNAGIVELDQVSANIYRSTIPKDDLSKKSLYNKLLRDMKFKMKVDTLVMKNSLLVYEEEKVEDRGPGVISFHKFNLLATQLESGFGQQKMADTKIKINCLFMNHSPMKVDWKFNVLDKNDGFTIKGSILNFDTKKLVSFTKPYINAKTDGKFDEVYFNIAGNDIASTGEFGLKYHDLKVTLYKKKDPKKKNKLTSAVANMFVKNDSDDEIKIVKVAVKRESYRSFYNFFWKNIEAGLKEVLI